MTDPTPAAAPANHDLPAGYADALLASLPPIRQKSIELLATIPTADFGKLRAMAADAVNYRETKKPKPGSVEEVILERKTDALVRAIEALGHDQDQAADMAGLLMTE